MASDFPPIGPDPRDSMLDELYDRIHNMRWFEAATMPPIRKPCDSYIPGSSLISASDLAEMDKNAKQIEHDIDSRDRHEELMEKMQKQFGVYDP